MTHSTSDLITLINGRSRVLAYDLVSPLGVFLTVARDNCGGDLDKALLMVAISLRASQHPGFKQLDAVALEGAGPLPGLGANVRSLADSTGIPKETVRRKIQQLVADGWVVRDGRNLRYSAEGYRAVAPARDSIIRMCVRGFEEIRALDEVAAEGRCAEGREA